MHGQMPSFLTCASRDRSQPTKDCIVIFEPADLMQLSDQHRYVKDLADKEQSF